LRNKDIDLPQLGDDLFRRVLLPWHVLILLDAIRHTSSRTTSVGVDHVNVDFQLGGFVKAYAAFKNGVTQ
jgi:hypothetical protein